MIPLESVYLPQCTKMSQVRSQYHISLTKNVKKVDMIILMIVTYMYISMHLKYKIKKKLFIWRSYAQTCVIHTYLGVFQLNTCTFNKVFLLCCIKMSENSWFSVMYGIMSEYRKWCHRKQCYTGVVP